jgi:hypothetical protein
VINFTTCWDDLIPLFNNALNHRRWYVDVYLSFVERYFQGKTELFGEKSAILSTTIPSYYDMKPNHALRNESSGINRKSRPRPFEGLLYVNVALP